MSLDAFRGITIAGMLLVNNPGSWRHVYAPLEHAQWDGWTFADLIFPSFLFIVGVAITLSLAGKIRRAKRRRRMLPVILRRTAILFVLGVLLGGFPFYDLSTIRIFGVLQRIAICYLVAALIFMFTSLRTRAAVAAALIVGYWALTAFVPVPATYVAQVVAQSRHPGVDDPTLYVAQNANLAAYVDNTLFRGHLWRQTETWDPEGLLSTIPAIATVLIGTLAGGWLTSRRAVGRKVLGLLIGGALAVVAGEIMNRWCPINKNLWSSSFVVLTGGMSMVFFALCYWLVDVEGHRRIATPWVIYGMNAIAVYVLSGILAQLLEVLALPVGLPDETTAYVSLRAFCYQRLFAPWAAPLNASLAFAIAFVVLMFVPAWLLHRHRIFITV